CGATPAARERTNSPAPSGRNDQLTRIGSEGAERRDVQAFGIFAYRREQRRGAGAVDPIALAASGGDQHVVTERSYGIEQDPAHRAGEVASRHAVDAGDGRGRRSSGVIDMDDAVGGGNIDVTVGKASQSQ